MKQTLLIWRKFPSCQEELVRNSLISRLKNAPVHASCSDCCLLKNSHWPWPGYLWAHREPRAEQCSLWTWRPTGPSSGCRLHAEPLWAASPSPEPGSWCSCTRCRWRPEPASWAACRLRPGWSWAIPGKKVSEAEENISSFQCVWLIQLGLWSQELWSLRAALVNFRKMFQTTFC